MDKYQTVDAFMNSLESDRHAQVQLLRQYILNAVPALTEHIKWNAPSYAKDNEDRITFNLLNKERVVKLVFHMGAVRKENKNGDPILKNSMLIDWVSDIRGYMTFRSLEEIVSQEDTIKRMIHEWIEIS